MQQFFQTDSILEKFYFDVQARLAHGNDLAHSWDHVERVYMRVYLEQFQRELAILGKNDLCPW